MNRIFFGLLLAFAPLAAHSATIDADFRAEASAYLGISATSLSTGQDLFDQLDYYVYDVEDFQSVTFGDATTASSSVNDANSVSREYGLRVSAQGSASATAPDSNASVGWYQTPGIFYEQACFDFGECSDDKLLIAFDYMLETMTETNVNDPAASADASAQAALRIRVNGFTSGNSYQLLNTQSGSGTVRALLEPGDAIEIFYVAAATGSAGLDEARSYDAPSAVPLPASMPLLAIGLLAVAGLGRLSHNRRRKSGEP